MLFYFVNKGDFSRSLDIWKSSIFCHPYAKLSEDYSIKSYSSLHFDICFCTQVKFILVCTVTNKLISSMLYGQTDNSALARTPQSTIFWLSSSTVDTSKSVSNIVINPRVLFKGNPQSILKYSIANSIANRLGLNSTYCKYLLKLNKAKII